MEVLHEWHEFYLLVGTAAATVLALLFVAVSLGAGYLTSQHQAPTRTFMSPVVIHFTSVFFVAAICLIPSHGPVFFSALIAATAVVGIVVSQSPPCRSSAGTGHNTCRTTSPTGCCRSRPILRC